ncbi:MAG TPA: hypothetical protein VFR82_01625 [Nitrospira sp.]|nr:hypothetical protein [Nitrospira sp.]
MIRTRLIPTADAAVSSQTSVAGSIFAVGPSATIVLLGGELNAEIEHQIAKDSTSGGNKPLGTRGAKMTDTVGAAQG